MALGSMNNINLLIHEHRIFFHLFVSSLIFFVRVLFSVYISFTFLVKFIPDYFIVFDAIINEIFSPKYSVLNV